MGVGRDIADEMSLRLTFECKCELRLNLCVFREGFGVVERNRGAIRIYLVSPLLRARERLRYMVDIAKEEVSSIDKHRAVRALRFDLEAAEHGLREGLQHRESFGGIGRTRAKRGVRFDQQELGARALEVHDAAFGGLTAIQAEVVGARTVGQ